MTPVTIGLIGCGNISPAYLKAARGFSALRVKAVADLDQKAAAARAAEFDIEAKSVEALLGDPEIEIVVNLTVPQAHVAVDLQVLEAGKHVYSEKPLAITPSETAPLTGRAPGLRIGCAPDTFLGGGHQTARKLVDDGAIGRPLAGTAFMMVAGHERWHPNPDFYYRPGGGPMLDMGPYYLTALVNLLGPVARVTGMAAAPRQTRTIGSGPRAGAVIPVETDTHIAGVLAFASGALITICTSFDVWKHGHGPLELYGETGALQIPDPNIFGGEVRLSKAGGAWEIVPHSHGYDDGNYRSIGVADLACAIRSGRPHRASFELARHVLEVMAAFGESARTGHSIEVKSRCERPAALPTNLAPGELDA